MPAGRYAAKWSIVIVISANNLSWKPLHPPNCLFPSVIVFTIILLRIIVLLYYIISTIIHFFFYVKGLFYFFWGILNYEVRTQ